MIDLNISQCIESGWQTGISFCRLTRVKHMADSCQTID